jgi:multiple sugar transport system substrate-binding protein
MSHKIVLMIKTLLVLVTIVALLAACAPAPTPTPTVEAAATQPPPTAVTATPVPPTATAVPATATLVPATATLVPATATPAPPTPTVEPPTPTAPPLDASCGGKGAIIQVHDWSSADRAEYWAQVLKAFNDAHPCIKAQTVKLPDDRAVRLTQLAAGTAPDLVGFDSSDLPLVYRKGFLIDLAPIMAADNFKPDANWIPGVYKTGMVDGKLVAVAKDYSTSAFYVNTALLQKAGITVPKEGWTYDQYLQMVQKLTVDTKGNNATSPDFDPKNVAVFGTSTPYWGGDTGWWRGFQSFLYSWGAHTISPDGKTTTGFINSANALKAWTWYRDLIFKYKVAPGASYLTASGVTNDKLFSDGKLAISGSFWGPWYQDTFNKAPNLQWQAVPLPTGPGGHHGAIMWMGWGISSTSKHPAEAWQLLKWLTTAPGQQVFALKALTGDIKTAQTLPALKDPYFATFLAEAKYQDQLDDMLSPFYTTCVDTNASKLMGKVFQDGGDKLDLKVELDTLAATADKCLSTSTIQ